jgi:hypothetical protein
VPDVFSIAVLGLSTFFCVALPFGTKSKFLFIDKLIAFFVLLLLLAYASTELPNYGMFPVVLSCHIAFNLLVVWDKLSCLEERQSKPFVCK